MVVKDLVTTLNETELVAAIIDKLDPNIRRILHKMTYVGVTTPVITDSLREQVNKYNLGTVSKHYLRCLAFY